MRKFVCISVIAVLISTFASAQQIPSSKAGNKLSPFALDQKYKNVKAQAFPKKPLRGDETVPQTGPSSRSVNKPITGIVNRSGVQAITSVNIGSTMYDLQSNNAVARRIINYGNGTISATWTMSQNTSFSDRGTGYNFFNGTTWGTLPTLRIEKDRNGWPNMFSDVSGGEHVITHLAGATGKDGLNHAFRTSTGTGTWTNVLTCIGNNFPTCDTGATWPRVAYSGNYVHVISSRLGGNWYGLVGGIAYLRSTDGGTTWETPIAIAGLDSNNFPRFGGDAYAIDANGSTVAFVCGTFQPTLFKSVDNGTTWTMKVLQPISYPKYSGDTLQLLDSVVSTDECYALLVDNNNIVHVWYGQNIVKDDSISKGWSYYPWSLGIRYWNENMTGTPVLIPETVPGDDDGDGNLTYYTEGLAASIYFSNGVSMPSAGVDANGSIYLTYSAVVENTSHTGDNTGYHYRNLNAIASHDGGKTWTQPVNLTKEEFLTGDEYKFSEVVYASVAKKVDDNLHIVYQKDEQPGYSLYTPTGGDAHPTVDNKINYLSIPACMLKAQVAKPQYVVCVNGSITLQASGGVSYAWSPGEFLSDSTIANPVFTPTTAIGYRYTVTTTDSKGCTSKAQLSAYGENLDSLSWLGPDERIMRGKSVELSTVDGADSYLWTPSTGLNNANIPNPIASPWNTTTYILEVKTGGCTDFDTIVVNVDTCQVTLSVAKSEYLVCFGESVTFEASGSTTYAWSPVTDLSDPSVSNPTFTPSAGFPLNQWKNFTVSYSDINGCNSSSNVRVWVVEPSSLASLGPDKIIRKGQSVLLTAPPGGDSYVWSPIEGLSNPNISNPLASPTVTSTYFVEVKSGNCTGYDTITVIVDTTTKIMNTISLNPTTVLFQNVPNPFNSNTTFIMELSNSANIDFSLSNMLGQKVSTIAKGQYNTGTHVFELSKKELDLKPGIYFYTLRMGTQTISKKMVVN